MKNKKNIFLIVIFLLSFSSVNAQTEKVLTHTVEGKEGFFPVPIMFYLPSTGYAFGAATLFYHNPEPENPERFPNIVGGFVTYSTKKQIQVGTRENFYFGDNDYRYDLDAAFFRTPKEFWGIGQPVGKKEDVTYDQYRVKMDFLFALKKDFYVGPYVWYEKFSLHEYEKGGMIDTLGLTGSMGVITSSLGIELALENRDSLFFPTKGYYIESKALFYRKMFGSDVDFFRFDLDVRYYISLFKQHVLGLNAILNHTSGDVPIQMMPKLGNYQMMRGYPANKYTDKSLWAAQAEYRIPVWWKIGASFFVGIGQIAPEISKFNTYDIKIAYGAGLRYLLDKAQHVNVRLDIAHSVEGTFAYFTIQEAF